MMFSGLSRHSGMRVYSVASTSRTSSSGGRSALIITMAVRWTMTSDTARSPKRKTFWMYSASPLSMPPCAADSSTSPSISESVRISCCDDSCTPSRRKIPRDALLSSQFSGQKTR